MSTYSSRLSTLVITTRLPRVAAMMVGGMMITAVAVSRLWAASPVGNGVRVGLGVLVKIGKLVGVGVQVLKTILSAPTDVAVIAGACCFDRPITVNNRLHIKITISTPQTMRNILALSLCLENQTENFLMVFMFFPFHLKLEMQTNNSIIYESILLFIW